MALTLREQNRKLWLIDAIEAIEQAQLGIFETGMSQMMFKGRSITHLSLDDLHRFRRLYANELEKLDMKERGQRRSRTVRVIG